MEQIISYLLYLLNQHPVAAFTMGVLLLMCLIGFILLLLSFKKFLILRNKIPASKSKRLLKFILPMGLMSTVLFSLYFVIMEGYISAKFQTSSTSSNWAIENTWISNSNESFGIDISHYQGTIDWEEVKNSSHPIEYVFVRSTMGADGKDVQFKRNWKTSKKSGFIRGAYHYYRPNENSVIQFRNFASTVELSSGDFPPVLDIEEIGKYGKENLVSGILNWLRLAEHHYGVKPIVYTGSNFYHQFLKGHIEDYPLWIAAYSGPHRLDGISWSFHQFSDKMRVKGINSFVDGNSFNGKMLDLVNLCIE